MILFVCKANSGRSQMAEGFFNRISKTNKAMSAGIKPDKALHPWTIKLMKEVGIDVSRNRPGRLTKKMLERAEKIIIVGSEVLKSIPPEYLSKVERWRIEKLLGKPINQVRRIRNKIGERVEKLIKEINETSRLKNC